MSDRKVCNRSCLGTGNNQTFGQVDRFVPAIRGIFKRVTSRFVRGLDNSHDFSCDHDDLPDHFDILVVAELFWTMELLGVGMDN